MRLFLGILVPLTGILVLIGQSAPSEPLPTPEVAFAIEGRVTRIDCTVWPVLDSLLDADELAPRFQDTTTYIAGYMWGDRVGALEDGNFAAALICERNAPEVLGALSSLANGSVVLPTSARFCGRFTSRADSRYIWSGYGNNRIEICREDLTGVTLPARLLYVERVWRGMLDPHGDLERFAEDGRAITTNVDRFEDSGRIELSCLSSRADRRVTMVYSDRVLDVPRRFRRFASARDRGSTLIFDFTIVPLNASAFSLPATPADLETVYSPLVDHFRSAAVVDVTPSEVPTPPDSRGGSSVRVVASSLIAFGVVGVILAIRRSFQLTT